MVNSANSAQILDVTSKLPCHPKSLKTRSTDTCFSVQCFGAQPLEDYPKVFLSPRE